MKLFGKLLLIGMALVLTIGLIDLAVALKPEYQTVAMSSDYYPIMQKDVVYTEQVKIDTTVSSYSNFELILWGDWKSGIVNVYINSQSCSPDGWTTPSADGYRIRFDCTEAVNLAENKKDLTLTYVSDKDAENVYGTVTANYLTKGEPVLEVFGTEYNYGQTAKPFLQLLSSEGDYINDGVCYIDIYTPDNDELVERATMTNAVHDGIYYYDIAVPISEGVYPVIAQCYYTASQDKRNASSYDLQRGEYKNGVIADTWIDNNDKLEIDTDDDSTPTKRVRVEFEFNDYYTNCGVVDEELLTGASFYWKGKWDTGSINHDVAFEVYNYTSSSWVTLDNEISGGQGGTIFSVANSLEFNNVTTALGVTSTNHMTLRFDDNDFDEGAKDFDTYNLYASCDLLADPSWEEVKGSSEIHVNGEKDSDGNAVNYVTTLLSGELTNTSFVEDFTFHFQVESATVQTLEEQTVELPLVYPFVCDHVTEVNQNYGNGTIVPITYSGSENGHCVIKAVITLEELGTYDIEVVSENFWKQQFGYWESTKALQKQILNISCQEYVIANNQTPFTIPMTTVPYGEDEIWLSCASYLDYEYHRSIVALNFAPLLNVNANFTSAEMHDLEGSWKHLETITNNLDDYGTIIMNSLELSSDYSYVITENANGLAPANWWATSFAYISTPYQNWLQLNGITTGATQCSINESAVSYDVWNYTGSIAPTILDAITFDVWDYENKTVDTDDLWVGGTEYSTIEETGKVIIRLSTALKDPVENANCELYVAYPNNTRYLSAITMTEANTSGFEGIYYIDFNHSGEIGVHPYAVNCTDPSNKNYFFLNTYHVFPDLNSTLLSEDIWNFTERELTGFPFDVEVLNRVDATTPEVLIGGTEYQIGDTGKLSIRLIKSQGGEGEPETSAECNGSILDPDDVLYVDQDAMTEYGEGIYTLDFSAPSTEGVYTYFIDCFAGNETENRSYFTLNTFHVSDISDDVWTRNQRNLTFYETSDETDYVQIQEMVWNRSTRDLTYYETADVTLDTSSIDAIGDAVWQYNETVDDNLLTQFGLKIECYVKNLLGGDDEWVVEIASC